LNKKTNIMIELKTKLIFQNIIVGAMETLLHATVKYPDDYAFSQANELAIDILRGKNSVIRLNSELRVLKINKLLNNS